MLSVAGFIMKPMKYDNGGNDEEYEPSVYALGFATYFFCMSPVPVWFFLHLRAIRQKHGFINARQVSLVPL